MALFNLLVLAAFEPKSWLPGILKGSEESTEGAGILPAIFSGSATDAEES